MLEDRELVALDRIEMTFGQWSPEDRYKVERELESMSGAFRLRELRERLERSGLLTVPPEASAHLDWILSGYSGAKGVGASFGRVG